MTSSSPPSRALAGLLAEVVWLTLCALGCAAGPPAEIPAQEDSGKTASGPRDKSERPPPGGQVAEQGGDSSTRGLVRSWPAASPPARGPGRYRRAHAVVIGINAYPGGNSQLESLRFAVNDARELSQILRDEFGFSADGMHMLMDGDATLAAMERSVTEWPASLHLEEDDCLLFFFAGHGLVDPASNEGFLAAVDSQRNQLATTCLPVAWLRDQLARLPCRHKLVILDSCYSGSLFRETSEVASHSPRTQPPSLAEAKLSRPNSSQFAGRGGLGGGGIDKLSLDFDQPAFWGFSAGRETPVADGFGAEQHSLFTANLLQVLRERTNSLRRDHAFTFRELAAQVYARVKSDQRSVQVPEWGRLGDGSGDFVFRPTLRRATPREQAARLTARQKYAMTVRAAQFAWDRYQSDLALEMLDSLRPAPGEEDLRGHEWYYLWFHCSRMREELSGHRANVVAAAFSHDGKLLASGDDQGRAHIWRPSGGLWQGQALPTARAPIGDLAFSPDHQLLAVAGGVSAPRGAAGYFHGFLQIHRVDGDAHPIEFDEPIGAVRRLAFFAGGQRLVTAGLNRDGRPDLRLWDVARRQSLSSLTGHEEPIESLAVSPAGQLLATGDRAGWIRLWHLPEGSPVASWKGHDDVVRSLAFSPDGSTLAVGSDDDTISLWDSHDQSARGVLRGHKSSIWGLAFSPGGVLLASVSDISLRSQVWGEVKLWDWRSRREVDSLQRRGGEIHCVGFAPQGDTLVFGNEAGSIWLWHLSRRSRQFSLHANAAIDMWSISSDPAGATLVAAESDGCARLWERQDDGYRMTRELRGHDKTVSGAALSPRGDLVATASLDGRVALWSKTAPPSPRFLTGHAGRVRDVAFVRGGDHLLSSGWDGQVIRWEVASGAIAKRYVGHVGPIKSLAVSQDGKWFATGGEDKTARIWRFDQEQPAQTFADDCGVWAVAFSPDGKSLATGNEEGKVVLWSIAKGTPSAVLSGHQSKVRRLLFSADGQRLFSASEDKSVRIWEPEVGRELLVLRGHEHFVHSLALLDEGRMLLSGSLDGQVHFWDGARESEVYDHFLAAAKTQPSIPLRQRELARAAWGRYQQARRSGQPIAVAASWLQECRAAVVQARMLGGSTEELEAWLEAIDNSLESSAFDRK